jgi:hypothetical protein
VKGIYLTTGHEGGGSHGRAGAAQVWLKMNGGHAMTINLGFFAQPPKRYISEICFQNDWENRFVSD